LLRWRLLSAAVIITVLLVLLYLDFHYPLGASGIWLLPLGLLASWMMVYELLDLWRDRLDRPVAWPVLVGAPLTVLAAGVPLLWPLRGMEYPRDCPIGILGWPVLASVLAVNVAFVAEMVRYRQPGRSTASIGLSVLTIVYAGLLPSFLVNLRLFGDHRRGMAALLSVIVIVKLSDTGAYFVGRQFGRHKLAPTLSPGKTVEGAIGAIFAACLTAWLCYVYLVPQIIGPLEAAGAWWAWLLLGLLCAGMGMIGDLAESLLKRDAQRKDSSSWLPGLGGVLDILDSVVFAAAPAYFFFATGWFGSNG